MVSSVSDVESKLDPKELRNALGQFATGVTVITACEPDGTPRGFTANSFTSVSLDPPLVLVCIANAAASCDVFVGARHFTINILCQDQQEVSGLFATQRPDKFELAQWSPGTHGAPRLANSLAWFECSHHQAVNAGDHVVLIGRVNAFDYTNLSPLGYFRGNYFSLGHENSLVEAMGRRARMIIGAVFEKDECLLLKVDAATGVISIPSVGDNNDDASIELLKRRYGSEPLHGTLEFVYSVFEDRRSGSVTLYYRGNATGDAPDGTEYFSFDSIPWDRVTDSATRTVLKRYIHEARTDRFAIYVGDESIGDVKQLK